MAGNAGQLRASLKALADLAREAADSPLCVLRLETVSSDLRIRSVDATTGVSASLTNAAEYLLAKLGAESNSDSGATLFVAPSEFTALGASGLGAAHARRAAALRKASGQGTVKTALVAAVAMPEQRIRATLELLAQAALETAAAQVFEAERGLWRSRATELGSKLSAELASVRADAAAGEDDRARVGRALEAASRASATKRFAALGGQAASLGPFNAWIVAAPEASVLEVVSASPGISLPVLDDRSAIADCFRRTAVIDRLTPPRRTVAYREDRLFGDGYICLPIDGGALALAAAGRPDWRDIARLQDFTARAGWIVRTWRLEEEVHRLRTANRSLMLRLFGAVDAERARIARDLHDDQAQMLAAARIALGSRRAAARQIFTRLEHELRSKVRELRPATAGRRSLKAALQAELRRLDAAGISSRLRFAAAGRFSSPAQNLCCQVVREAVSNVIRHSGATRVEVTIERSGAAMRLKVLDNGRGRAAPRPSDGGLLAMAERVHLLGGRLDLQSHRGATKLVVEIPELAS